ncbi:hypothetical protein M422DRAFT_265878 [Sphaerobolus stellatus SS14]|uniref:Uncharacterized protein n=1 Tax=Sphaerobolus stellatus (strain SS14) TaxID=990650 RepID=A0A0C9UCJ4_SPHS4|nr:hypothetical protein M422DRAFT_265878 [Sphaerobolus stellatus SS14]
MSDFDRRPISGYEIFCAAILNQVLPTNLKIGTFVPEDDVVQLEVLTRMWPQLSHLTINQRSTSSQLDKPRITSAIRLFLDEHKKSRTFSYDYPSSLLHQYSPLKRSNA